MSTSIVNGTAVVTGGAQGIGRAICIRLAADGYNVVISDLNSQREKASEVVDHIQSHLGGRAVFFAADVSKEEDVEGLVRRAVDEFGGVDVMVANAGIAVANSILDTTVEEWERVFSVNVKGTLLCYKTAAKQMIAGEKGRNIIGACSLAGKKSGAYGSTYGSSKFAIRCLTQSAAAEWGPHGIRVNAYAPGIINTDMFAKMETRATEMMHLPAGSYAETMIPQTALRRVGEPEEIANLVSFLVSKEAAFITGQSISIDGGVWFD